MSDDLYAVGIILFMMIAGKHPFSWFRSERNDEEMIKKKNNTTYPGRRRTGKLSNFLLSSRNCLKRWLLSSERIGYRWMKFFPTHGFKLKLADTIKFKKIDKIKFKKSLMNFMN